MASNMRTSRAGLDVIKASEGFRARYGQLSDGRWIIGYGHVRKDKEGVRVSEPEAEAILREYDLPPIERLVTDCVLAPLNQNEFDALVSLAFNIGAKAFASSDVVAHINAGNRLAAASAFDHWRKAKIGGRVQIVDALVRRRAVEKALFLRAPGHMPVASSRVYRALHDKAGLPAPKRPREILVEHRSPEKIGSRSEVQPEKPVTVADKSTTATEAAAASVRAQIVRILGEDGNKVRGEDDTTDGASPEEITAAVSELAGEGDERAVRKSMWPQREDLPPPPHLERVLTEDRTADQSSTHTHKAKPKARERVAMVDDLEEVEVPLASLEEAEELDKQIHLEETTGRLLDAAPFGLLALIGAGLGGYGLASQAGLVDTAATADNAGLAGFLPAFLMCLGGVLLVVMGYYFFRTMFDRD